MIEKSILSISGKVNSLFEWFINQNHIPFDLNEQQLKELVSLFKLTNSKYYWFGSNGRLMSDEGAEICDNNFKVDRDILRLIVRDNILEELLPK